MSNSKVAAITYTVRDFVKTPKDIAASLKKIKAIGYDNVQLSALGPIDPQELKSILDGEGLNVCATHENFDRVLNDLDAIIAEHHLWGCPNLAIGGLPASYQNVEGFAKFAEATRAFMPKLADANLTFSYHNHAWELAKFEGRRALDIMFEACDPRVCFEIDTYWIQIGGGDPAAWIRKMENRIPILHLKDMGVSGKEPFMAEVGEGNLNWPAIFSASQAAGAKWYIVEQDWCAGDPFDSLALSLRNLKAMGVT